MYDVAYLRSYGWKHQLDASIESVWLKCTRFFEWINSWCCLRILLHSLHFAFTSYFLFFWPQIFSFLFFLNPVFFIFLFFSSFSPSFFLTNLSFLSSPFFLFLYSVSLICHSFFSSFYNLECCFDHQWVKKGISFQQQSFCS